MLDNNQLKAVNFGTGPALIIAGPGSGKTTVITHHILNLIEKQSIDPKRILVITFTKSAAVEMQQRFEKLSKCSYKVNFGTFHSIFYKFLNLYSKDKLSIISSSQKEEILTKINNTSYSDDDIIQKISYIKSFLSFEYTSDLSVEIMPVLKDYNQILELNRLLDYDDIILNCYKLVKENELIRNNISSLFDAILVDEFQDINEIQYETLKLISHNNLYVVGDEDQAIYSFRGSNPLIMKSFINDFPDNTKIYLNMNYRSEKEIVLYANRVISLNSERIKSSNEIKCFLDHKTQAVFINKLKSEEDEIEAVKSEIDKHNDESANLAILFRNNKDLEKFRNRICNDSNEVTSIENTINSIVLNYINASVSSDESAIKKIINIPERYIPISALIRNGKREIITSAKTLYITDTINIFYRQLETLKKMSPYSFTMYLFNIIGIRDYLLNKYGNEQYDLNSIIDKVLFTAKTYSSLEEFRRKIHISNNKKDTNNKDTNIRDTNNKDTNNKDTNYKVTNNKNIQFLTFHASKGLEFDYVFIPTVNEGKIPSKGSDGNPKLLEEERRLFYVAITRAKKEVHIYSIDNPEFAPVSRFVL